MYRRSCNYLQHLACSLVSTTELQLYRATVSPSAVPILNYVHSKETEQNLLLAALVLQLDLPLLLLGTLSGQYSTAWEMDNKCVCL